MIDFWLHQKVIPLTYENFNSLFDTNLKYVPNLWLQSRISLCWSSLINIWRECNGFCKIPLLRKAYPKCIHATCWPCSFPVRLVALRWIIVPLQRRLSSLWISKFIVLSCEWNVIKGFYDISLSPSSLQNRR